MKTSIDSKQANTRAKDRTDPANLVDPPTHSPSDLYARSFTIRRDQYEDLLQLAAFNKILGSGPSNSSEIMREALDMYFAKLGDDKYWRI